MSGRRRILLFAAGVVAAVTLVLIFWPEEPEPSYQGKKLSEWLERYELDDGPIMIRESARTDAVEAVRQIRAEAMPVLLRWMEYRQPLWRQKLARAALELPPIFGGGPALEHFVSGRGASHYSMAFLGFRLLGPDAKEAIPELAQRLSSTNSDLARDAIYTLGLIGKDGFPLLLTVLTNTTSPHRQWAALAISLRTNATDAAAAAVVLAQFFNDSDEWLASASIVSLGRLAIEPGTVVPALTVALGNPSTSAVAARALSRFGPAARAAVPALLRATADPEWGVRYAVTNALLQIAPEVLTNGVAK